MTIQKAFFLAAAWFLFAVAGAYFFKTESSRVVFQKETKQVFVQPGIYQGTEDLTKISGDQVLGMIPYALEGEFVLIVDGISINSSTDLSTINFTGVPGLTYSLSLTRDTDNKISTVTVNKM